MFWVGEGGAEEKRKECTAPSFRKAQKNCAESSGRCQEHDVAEENVGRDNIREVRAYKKTVLIFFKTVFFV